MRNLIERRKIMANISGYWMNAATEAAILGAFGQTDGYAVIKATNDYLNSIAATDTQRAQQLAMFINEDPMLVVSLVETSKERWLVGDEKAYIVTDIRLTRDAVISETLAAYTHTKNTNNVIFGSYPGSYYLVSSWDGNYFIANGVNNAYTQPIQVGVPRFFRIECLNGKARAYLDGTLYCEGNATTLNTESIAIMARHYSKGSYDQNSGHKVAYIRFKDANETPVFYFVPFLRNGEAGMLDIISGTFYPNANTTGAFTIAYTLPDGTPWTPLNQTH